MGLKLWELALQEANYAYRDEIGRCFYRMTQNPGAVIIHKKYGNETITMR